MDSSSCSAESSLRCERLNPNLSSQYNYSNRSCSSGLICCAVEY
uniref:Uncharacterized protein n=1 Tax=Arundo donax TaxID=35708 RepID=A0A0A9HCR9_ARUDO